MYPHQHHDNAVSGFFCHRFKGFTAALAGVNHCEACINRLANNFFAAGFLIICRFATSFYVCPHRTVRATYCHHRPRLHMVGYAQAQFAQFARHSVLTRISPGQRLVGVIRVMLVYDVTHNHISPRRLNAEAAAMANPCQPYYFAF